MTWYVDPDTGEVHWDQLSDTLVGTIDAPPYTIPDDCWTVYYNEMFPSEHSSIDMQTLRAGFELCEGNVEFGTPPP